jgi:pilus assembly protein FimV
MADSYPGYDNRKRTVGTTKVSGTGGAGTDPTNEPGQYPPGTDHGIFGGPLPTGTGAPGTAGAGGSADATNEPGQTQDGLTGISEHDITATGAPGTQGTTPTSGGGPDSISFTRPTAGVTTYEGLTVNDSVGGPADWTQANDDGYASSGPKLPAMQEPEAGTGRFQPGGGHVLRGGRAVRG